MARRINGNGDPLGPGLRRLTGIAAELARPEGAASRRAGLILEAEIKQTLSQPGSGRTYPSRGSGDVLHQASAPGEPPAPDLGELRRTIGQEVVDDRRRVGSPLEHAPGLEFGSLPHVIRAKNASVLANSAGQVFGAVVHHPGNAPRPFMRPALAKARNQMTEDVTVELRVQGRKVGYAPE